MKDITWENYGKKDPYFGVLTDPRYKSENLNEVALKEFFKSGDEHTTDVLTKLKYFFPFATIENFKKVLDFGCGTGRLLIPFAQRFEHVTGIDISQGMLNEADKNLKERGLQNVVLLKSEDITKVNFSETFDFVHTFIVLQHIPVKAGYTIIDKLISIVKEGGYGMIHFTYANNMSAYKNKRYSLKAKYKWFHQFSNILKGQSPNAPLMQMNNYDLKQIFQILRQHKLKQTSLDFTDHGGFLLSLIHI